jgi:hypothetical protein
MVPLETIHPIDRLKLIQELSNTNGDPLISNLIEALLTIIDGLHNRICELEEAREPRCEMCDKPAPYGSVYCSSVCYYAASDQDPWSS